MPIPELNYRARKADIDALREYPRNTIHLDTYWGNDGWEGKDWDHAVQTMTRALALVETGGRILFKGKITEECTASNLKFDVTIQGVGSLHHADQPGSGTALYDYGSSVWQSPDSQAAPLLTLRGRGWRVKNIMFDCPTAYAGIRLARNSSSGTDEYDAGHCIISGCDFRNGKYGIEDYDGNFNVTVEDCVFETLDATGAVAIGQNSGGGPASPRRWRIINNFFQPDSSTEGNLAHIDLDLQGGLIKGNVFGTVKSTGIYIDLTGGVGNVLYDNLFMGVYNTSDYKPGTGDSWSGNQSLSISLDDGATTDATGWTIRAPQAAT